MKREGTQKDIAFKQKQEESGSYTTYIRQNRLKTKATEEYKGHYIIIKGSIQKEEFTLVNIYAPNT